MIAGTQPATWQAYKLLHDGARALAHVENGGLRVDREKLTETLDVVSDSIRRGAAGLRENPVYERWSSRYGSDTNLDSRDQLAVILFDDMGLQHPTGERNKKGWVCDAGVLSKVDSDFTAPYLKVQKLEKLHGTYLQPIKNLLVGEYLHPGFGLHKAISYRSSCENPNFQNIPIRNPVIGKLIRSIFCAPDGYHMLELDYGSIEVRVAACYHQDPTMLRYIATGYDMHAQMAAKCLKYDPDTFKQWLKEGNKAAKGLRQLIKGAFVFAQFYGSWYKQCAEEIWSACQSMTCPTGEGTVADHLRRVGVDQLGTEWTRSQGRNGRTYERPPAGSFYAHIADVEEWFWKSTFPRYDKWRRDRYTQYKADGGFSTLTGFRCWGPMSRNQVINLPVQGSAFHCLLWSIIELVKTLRKEKWQSRVCGQIHDSCVAYAHESELSDFLKLAEHIMVTELSDAWKWIITDLVVEAEVCPLGGSWHDKKEVII